LSLWSPIQPRDDPIPQCLGEYSFAAASIAAFSRPGA